MLIVYPNRDGTLWPLKEHGFAIFRENLRDQNRPRPIAWGWRLSNVSSACHLDASNLAAQVQLSLHLGSDN